MQASIKALRLSIKPKMEARLRKANETSIFPDSKGRRRNGDPRSVRLQRSGRSLAKPVNREHAEDRQIPLQPGSEILR